MSLNAVLCMYMDGKCCHMFCVYVTTFLRLLPFLLSSSFIVKNVVEVIYADI